MRINILRPHGELKQELWEFDIGLNLHPPCIYLSRYTFQTRATTRHRKWRMETHWERFGRRNNNIPFPPIPLDVDKEVHAKYQEYINSLPIVPRQEGKQG